MEHSALDGRGGQTSLAMGFRLMFTAVQVSHVFRQ